MEGIRRVLLADTGEEFRLGFAAAVENEPDIQIIGQTGDGEELLRLAVEPTLSMEERAFLRLTPEERRTFLDLSHRYLNAIREEAEPLLAQPAPEEWEEV